MLKAEKSRPAAGALPRPRGGWTGDEDGGEVRANRVVPLSPDGGVTAPGRAGWGYWATRSVAATARWPRQSGSCWTGSDLSTTRDLTAVASSIHAPASGARRAASSRRLCSFRQISEPTSVATLVERRREVHIEQVALHVRGPALVTRLRAAPRRPARRPRQMRRHCPGDARKVRFQLRPA